MLTLICGLLPPPTGVWAEAQVGAKTQKQQRGDCRALAVPLANILPRAFPDEAPNQAQGFAKLKLAQAGGTPVGGTGFPFKAM